MTRPSDAELRLLAERMDRLTSEEIAAAMGKLPTDALEWAVRFEALGNRLLSGKAK